MIKLTSSVRMTWAFTINRRFVVLPASYAFGELLNIFIFKE